MNAKQRRKTGRPLSWEGTLSKYKSWINHCPDPVFGRWLRALTPREIAGFALHGDGVIEYVGGNTAVRSQFKKDIKNFVNELAEKELLSSDVMNTIADNDLLGNNNEDDS